MLKALEIPVAAVCMPAIAPRILAGALPAGTGVLLEAEFEVMRQKLNQLPNRPRMCGLLRTIGRPPQVYSCWFPVYPSGGDPVHLHQPIPAGAARSKVVAIAMLFVVGYAFGRRSGSARACGPGDGGPR